MSENPKTPVILLHGVGLDHTMWQPLQELLGRPSTALDLPGHGAQPPLRTEQSLASLAEDVAARIPTGQPVHLVGFSLGALIAQQLARHLPSRVATLTSVNSVCQRTDAEAAAVEQRLATAGTDFDAGVQRALERWYPAGVSTVPAAVIQATGAVLRANDLESYLHAYTVFARGDRQIGAELDRITAPSLAITGELDPGSTPDMSRRLGRAIPNCTVRIIPGARHMLPVENAAALAAELTTFFSLYEGNAS